MNNQTAPDLRDIPLFSTMPKNALDYLQKRLRTVKYTEGQTILPKGKRGRYLAIVGTGQVELTGSMDQSRMLEPGDLFGEGMMRYGVASSYSAAAHSDVVLWLLGRTDWLVAKELPDTAVLSEPADHINDVTPLWLKAGLVLIVLTLILLAPLLPEITNSTLTRLSIDAGRPDLAEHYFNFLLQLDSDEASLYDYFGFNIAQQGRYAEAASAFQNALAIDGEFPTAQNNLAVTLINLQSDVDNAVEHMRAAVDLNPGLAILHFNLGNAYLLDNELESAKKSYHQAYKLDPTYLDARAYWGIIALGEGDYYSARSALERVVENRPNHALANKGLGVVAFLEGRYDQAISHLTAALASNPDDSTARFYYGITLEAQNKPTEAVAEFEKVFELSNNQDLRNLALDHLEAIKP
jgi:tetratricopeptide (TPR) repeat protein